MKKKLFFRLTLNVDLMPNLKIIGLINNIINQTVDFVRSLRAGSLCTIE